MTARTRRGPDAGHAEAAGHHRRPEYTSAMRALYGQPAVQTDRRLPQDWRERLPDPASYYAAHVEGLGAPNADGWAACRCLFHPDRTASASANLRTGGYRCHGCGVSGDIIAIHQRITGLPFRDAVRDLLGLGR